LLGGLFNSLIIDGLDALGKFRAHLGGNLFGGLIGPGFELILKRILSQERRSHSSDESHGFHIWEKRVIALFFSEYRKLFLFQRASRIRSGRDQGTPATWFLK